MKRFGMLGICLVWLSGVMAQRPESIPALELPVGFNKTTTLLFPYAVRSVDRGSRDLLVQKVKGMENVLQVKAGIAGFTETNLSVITADGKLYAFRVQYATDPPWLNIRFPKQEKDSTRLIVFSDHRNAAVLQETAASVLRAPRFMRVRDHSYGMRLRLNGLYIHNNIFYYQLELSNHTHLAYEVELLQFYIKDARQSRRTASQEVVQEPLLVMGNATVVEGMRHNKVVVALPQCTIPNQQELIVQVMEKNGGRHLRLRLNNRKLVRARVID